MLCELVVERKIRKIPSLNMKIPCLARIHPSLHTIDFIWLERETSQLNCVATDDMEKKCGGFSICLMRPFNRTLGRKEETTGRRNFQSFDLLNIHVRLLYLYLSLNLSIKCPKNRQSRHNFDFYTQIRLSRCRRDKHTKN